MKKIIFVISFMVLSGFIFGLSVTEVKAQTVAELQAQIQQLMTQIASLQQQLAQLQGGQQAATWCHTFNVNLGVGNRGPEVTALQTALQKEGLYQRTISGNFDEYTASIVVAFQEKYASEILTPWRLVRGTGYVGPTTRAKLNKLYGCDVVRPLITVNYVQSPAQERNILRPGEVAHVYGSNFDNTATIYVRMIGKAEDRRMRAYNVSIGNLDFIVPTVDTGEYDLFVEQKGVESNKIKVKVVSGPTVPFITLLSPNGGENWQIGKTYQIKWKSHGIDKVDIRVRNVSDSPVGVLIASGVAADLGMYSWIISSVNFSPRNDYEVGISGVVDGEVIGDQSDNYFSIIAESVPPAPILSPVGGEKWEQGTSQVIRWTPYEKPVSSVIISLYQNGVFQKTLSGVIPDSSGQWTWNIPVNQSIGSSYSIRVSRLSYPNDFIADSNFFSIVAASVSCIDSDGGRNYYVRGTCIGRPNIYTDEIRTLTDHCITPRPDYNYDLIEYACGYVNNIEICVPYAYKCPYGCKEGACNPGITVNSPNGGESWQMGRTYPITWKSGGVSRVNIAACRSEDDFSCVLIGPKEGVDASLGRYDWTIQRLPAFVEVGSRLKIRITDYNNHTVRDFSDNHFNIVGSEEILVSGHDFYVKTADTGTGNWSFAKDSCEALGSGWTLPTMTQLRILYQKKNEIGGFKDEAYWSSDMGMYIHFINGFESSMNPAMTFPSFRCVKNANVLGAQVTESQLASLSNIISIMIEQFKGLLWR